MFSLTGAEQRRGSLARSDHLNDSSASGAQRGLAAVHQRMHQLEAYHPGPAAVVSGGRGSIRAQLLWYRTHPSGRLEAAPNGPSRMIG
jgi:hypothetical protein